MWTRGQATHCLDSGIAAVAEQRGDGRRNGGGGEIRPEIIQVCVPGGRRGGAPTLAASEASDPAIQRQGRRVSDAFVHEIHEGASGASSLGFRSEVMAKV